MKSADDQLNRSGIGFFESNLNGMGLMGRIAGVAVIIVMAPIMGAHWWSNCWSRSMSKISEASRDHIADENFAFPKERKEPIHDAAHVRNAIARFKQVQGVTEAERDEAWKRIKAAANKYKVELNEQDWRELS